MKSKSKSNIVSDTLFIGFLTAFSYLCTFLFEFAYLDYFKIDWSFITLDLNQIIIVFIGIVVVFSSILPIIDLFSTSNLFKLNTGIRMRIFINTVSYFYLFINILIFKNEYKEWLPFGLIIFLYSLNDFIFPIFNKSNIKYSEKVNLDYENERAFKNKTISNRFMDVLIEKYGKSSLLVCILIILLPFISYNMGRIYAHKKNEFLSFELSSKKFIVIKNNNNYLISKSISDNNLNNEMIFLKIDDLNNNKIFLKNEKFKNLKIYK